METKQILDSMTTERIVTRPCGSWKWQQAYAVSSYCAKASADGTVRWNCFHSSQKVSMPQIKRLGWEAPLGGLHGAPIRRSDAVEIVGRRAVGFLERRGFRFA